MSKRYIGKMYVVDSTGSITFTNQSNQTTQTSNFEKLRVSISGYSYKPGKPRGNPQGEDQHCLNISSYRLSFHLLPHLPVCMPAIQKVCIFLAMVKCQSWNMYIDGMCNEIPRITHTFNEISGHSCIHFLPRIYETIVSYWGKQQR